MMYPSLKFPKLKNRPYFYTNFVTTVDGRAQVVTKPKDYWPIGSELDYKTLIELRSHADVLVHGKNTATWVRMVDKLMQGRKKLITYAVISGHPDDTLIPYLENPVKGATVILVTTDKAKVSKKLASSVNVLRLGSSTVNLKKLSEYFFENNLKTVLVEGGPHLMGSFFKEDLIDEVFLTIAPKIFGNQKGSAITMVEGHLLPSDKVKNLKLLSSKAVGDELYLRYKVIK